MIFDKKRFSYNVRDAFDECGKYATFNEVAFLMGLSPQNFSSQFTACRNVPSAAKVAQLAKLLGTSADELLEGCTEC